MFLVSVIGTTLALQSPVSPTRLPAKPPKQSTAVYGLLAANFGIFMADKVTPLHSLYLNHAAFRAYQPLTACFCHSTRSHLSGNLFLLLLFGRSVEDDWGPNGLLVAYAFCGILANLASLAILPRATISLGASGSVYGLFAVSVLSVRSLEWRKVTELLVLGDFVVSRVLSEMKTAAMGGIPGVNHVAHIAGAAAGAFLVLLLRIIDRSSRNID
ncbi:hypothetical protein CTAYLR_009526 [Chrysophaeum taylorii]|uniref:Peptidase S54 rhomboid domain-containing protein n=1 Tax=Chrysophaeum taylorii TaxID=2483200 RepID=A0AAD7UIM7_9STRA|nr:hypothetical protein CTAYLR_009526 [Chrysophaeum taylorii]